MESIKGSEGVISLVAAVTSLGSAYYSYSQITQLKKDVADLIENVKPAIDDMSSLSDISGILERIEKDMSDLDIHNDNMVRRIQILERTVNIMLDSIKKLELKNGIDSSSTTTASLTGVQTGIRNPTIGDLQDTSIRRRPPLRRYMDKERRQRPRQLNRPATDYDDDYEDEMDRIDRARY